MIEVWRKTFGRAGARSKRRALLAIVVTVGAVVSAPSAGASVVEPKPLHVAPAFVAGEMLVGFDVNAPESERQRVRQRHQLELVRDVSLPGVELVRTGGGASVPDRAAAVARERSVRYAEPNYLWRPESVTPDPELDDLWGLDNDGQTGGTIDADIDAAESWPTAFGDDDVVVGVIDTGIDIDHPDLASIIWTNPDEIAGDEIDNDTNGYIDDVHGWDFANGDNSVFDETDPDDHGTHVAGTIAAVRDNGVNVAGVSRARIMPLKFLGPGGGDTADAVDAIAYAITERARLTNNSWGGGPYSQALFDAISAANTAGQLFIAAAGNEGTNNDGTPHYPSNYGLPNVISVAATTHTDDVASFSNFGATSVDIGAPGDEILSTVPQFAKAVVVDNGTYFSAYHAFGLEGVTDANDREALLGAALGWASASTSDAVLVVDDDNGATFQGSYTDALDTLGYTNRTTFTTGTKGNCAGRHGPTASAMSGTVVVWFTGRDSGCSPTGAENTLTSTDQTQLTTFLNGGGTLLLFGQDIGFDLTEDGATANTFLASLLKVGYVADYDINFRPAGVAGTPYAGIGTIELTEGTTGAGQTYSSVLRPLTGAVAAMRGAPSTWFGGTSMATPHVSGAAAILSAAWPDRSHLEIRDLIYATAESIPALAGITTTGKRLNLANAMVAVANPNFGGGDGTAVSSLGSATEVATAVAIDGVGRTIAVGYSGSSGIVSRYTTAGVLDPAFDGDGVASLSAGVGSTVLRGVAVQPDGRIVVAGSVLGASDFDVVVARYDATGELDTSFSGDGIVVTGVGATDDQATDVAIDGSGRIVVAGSTLGNAGYDTLLLRYEDDGDPDTTFAGDGSVVQSLASASDWMEGLALDGSGRIVVAGAGDDGSGFAATAARFDASGALDTTFSGDGIARLVLGTVSYSHDVVIDPADRPLLAATVWTSGGYDAAIVRLTTGGVADTTFDGDGVVINAESGHEIAYGVAVTGGGKIVVTGGRFATTDTTMLLITWDAVAGIGRAALHPAGRSVGYDVAIDSGGDVIAAGQSVTSNDADHVVARVLLA